MARRLLLLEILPDDRYRNYRSQYYPFAAGLERRLGGAVRWICAGVETIPVGSGRNPFVYSLSRGDGEALGEILRDFDPTHVMVNERLDEDLWQGLRAAAPGASFSLSDILLRRRSLWDYKLWAGIHLNDLDPGGLIEEQATPWFGKEALNDAAVALRPFTHVIAGPECVYAAPLSRNPWYEDVDLAACSRDYGCSFCDCPEIASDLPDGDAVELAVDQVLAAEAGLPEIFRTRDYLVRGSNLLPRLPEFFHSLMDAKLPPSEFRIGCRLDEFVRLDAGLRGLLPRMEEAGHCLHLWNMGIENFSLDENQRFHKGLTPETIDRGIRLLRDLRLAFPSAFRPPEGDGFGFILFTPWTTLEDLRINVREFRRHDLQVPTAFVASALQLLPGRPITALAEAHGLTTDHAEESLDSGCITTWDEEEVPWRFKEPAVARVHHIARRLVPGRATSPEEPAFQRINGWWINIKQSGATLLDVFEALIEAAATATDQDTKALLHDVEARLSLEPVDIKDWPHIAATAASRLPTWNITPRQGGRPGLDLTGPDGLTLIAEPRTPDAKAFLLGRQWLLYYPKDARTPEAAERSLLEEVLAVLDSL